MALDNLAGGNLLTGGEKSEQKIGETLALVGSLTTVGQQEEGRSG